MKLGSNGCSVNCSGPQSKVSATWPDREGSGLELHKAMHEIWYWMCGSGLVPSHTSQEVHW